MSEIKSIDHLVATDVLDMRARIETLEKENAALKDTCAANRRYRIRRGEYVAALRADRDAMAQKCDTLKAENAALQKERDEWRDLWSINFKECKRLIELCEKQQTEIDRSIEQLAELTEQYEQLARKYNALAPSNVVKDFEPVKIGGEDGN